MRCTAKKTFESITSSQNQLLVQVKANQKALLAQITAFTKTGAPLSIHTSKTRGRNRTETRVVCVHNPVEALSDGPWAGLIKAVIVVERLVWIRDPATSLLKKRSETAFYAASCLMEAKICATAIRNHWQIENCNHHVRDVTFEEDKSRIRTRPLIMARLRSFALNILRYNGAQNIARERHTNSLNPLNMFNYRGLSSEN